MRIPIAVQLALLVLIIALVGIAALSIATWMTTYAFVVDVAARSLRLVATIKASQITSNLALLETTCKTIATRLLIQAAIKRYNDGNTSSANWVAATSDFQSALGSRGYLSLYQTVLFSKTGNRSERLLSVTSDAVPEVTLPYTHANGSSVQLGQGSLGYPSVLYPNLTYTTSSNGSTIVQAFPEYILGLNTTLLLGPLRINDSFSLMSLTVPIINNTSKTEVLAFMTVLTSGETVQNVMSSRDGLGTSAQVLLLGPSRPENLFTSNNQPATASSLPGAVTLVNAEVHYVFEPIALLNQPNRHRGVSTDTNFALSKYPTALEAMLEPYESTDTDKSISNLSTSNEEGSSVAVGVIRPQSSLVQWILIVEESHSEAFSPVSRLRVIILSCVFGTAGAVILVVPLLTHWAVAPVRRLRDAAQKSVTPKNSPSTPHLQANCHRIDPFYLGRNRAGAAEEALNEKRPTFLWMKHSQRLLTLSNNPSTKYSSASGDFQIPRRVRERKTFVKDELTELTETFNEMADELNIQYSRLEERVLERTRELEKAKLVAETANESKTLFIANISHELKTPLNGILGMCAVCMGEEDLTRIKKSLQVVYQSGDLLLHLLNDLLTFSKNQIEQAIQLEEKEFKLSDIQSQVTTIFQNQVHEKNIDFSVYCLSAEATNHVKSSTYLGKSHESQVQSEPGQDATQHTALTDVILLGDQHRILQILINIVSNGLKFTPEYGKVEVRIRCLGERPKSSLEVSAPILHQNIKETSHSRSEGHPPTITSLGIIQTPAHEIEEEQIQRQADEKTLMFQFEIKDNGPGIPLHLQNRIFDPFVQGDLGLNRKYGGTGLGLSICAQLSRIMGGVIMVDSQEGIGSTFTLRIPLKFVKEIPPSTLNSSRPGSRAPSILSLEDFSNTARTPSNHSSVRSQSVAPGFGENSELQPRLVGLSQPFFSPTVPSPSLSTPRSPGAHLASDGGSRKKRVLVAEDNSVNQEVVKRMLALEQVYDVTICKDGQEAFDTVKLNMEKGTVFDLIFMDIQMPNLDGLQSTRLIREIGYSAPIVALSAFAEESNINDCMECGMDMFISKPIRRPALKQVLSKFATIPEDFEVVSS